MLKIGIQLFSVRDRMKKDPVGAIREIAGLGYRYIEPANHNATEDFGVGFGITADEMLQVLKDTGTRVVGSHIFPFREENAARVLAFNKKIGNPYVVYPQEMYRSKEQIEEVCAFLNQMGRLCRESGLMLLYHNHFQEFQKFDGKTVMDNIVENTEPRYVGLELDTYWALRGGWDPCEALHHFGQRVRLVHQKDYVKAKDAPVNLFEKIGYDAEITTREKFRESYSHDGFTEVGTGEMDIQKIIDTANGLGTVEYMILEQDFTKRDQMESVRISMESFRKYRGIAWD